VKIISTPEKLCKGHYLLHIECDEDCLPGQFVSFKLGRFTDPLIRRPFSIFNKNGNDIEVVFKENGRVTSMLKNMTDFSDVDVSGPYGRGFTITENENVLLIGGGVGNAPLHYLSKVLKTKNNNINFIYAARSQEFIYCGDRFCTESNEICYVTDDGSFGDKGFAADKLKAVIEKTKFSRAYICGPTVMMKSCAEILIKENIPLEVSLENYFGCGIGICSGCSVDTIDGKKRACVDGPVFDGSKLLWQYL